MSEERPLLGPYHIERRLAAGGMAEVFVALREGLHGFQKRVALKRILPQFSSDPDFVWMFIDEARLAALLEHPNIVQVFDFGTMGDDLVLVMELVDGSNVSRLLRAAPPDSPIPWDVALHIAYQTAQALEYAHHAVDENGEPLEFVHRDVSPANILLSRTGHVKLTDFGIATVRSRAPTTEDGQVRGKLGYMSPEQVLGKELSGKSDVFTLSTVLAEMLIGEPLFQGESELNVLLQIRDADLRVLARCERRIPQDIRAVVLRGLQRDPKERPTAGAFAEACAEVMRRRGMGHGPDRVARLLSQLNLIDGDAPEIHLPDANVPSLVDSDLMHHAGQELIGPQAVTSPTIYRVQLPDGSVMGPMSYPRLIQLLTTGVIDSRSSKISKSDGTYIDPSSLPELTRFVTSPGLQWKLEELAQAEKQGQLRAATLLPVFYDIIARQQTGVLHLWQRNRRKKIYFVEGRPEFVASTDKSELLGEYLVATGQCLRMEIEMALGALAQVRWTSRRCARRSRNPTPRRVIPGDQRSGPRSSDGGVPLAAGRVGFRSRRSESRGDVSHWGWTRTSSSAMPQGRRTSRRSSPCSSRFASECSSAVKTGHHYRLSAWTAAGSACWTRFRGIRRSEACLRATERVQGPI